MLENTKIWTKGKLELFLNNEPQEVYVTPESVHDTYKDLQSTLTNDGSVPIGIDHLPEAVIKANPVLEKLDLLNVGTITAVDYNTADDSIEIKEATLTNPLIKDLYLKGELDSVSIVAPATVKTCPQNDDVLIVEKTTINRVDIVGHFIAADGAHVGVKTFPDGKSVLFQSIAFPLRQGLNDLPVFAGLLDVKRHRAFHAVEVIIQACGRIYKKRCRDTQQVQTLCQKVLEEVLDHLDGHLCLMQIQCGRVVFRNTKILHDVRWYLS